MTSFEENNEGILGERLSQARKEIRPDRAFAERLLRALPETSVTVPVYAKSATAPWMRALLLAPVALAVILFAQVEQIGVDPVLDVYALEVEVDEMEDELMLDYETLDSEAETEMDLLEMETFDENATH